MLANWTRTIIRFRALVLIIWLAILGIGVLAGAHLDSHLTTSLSVPGSQSAKADQILESAFHENVEGSFTILYKFKNATPTQIEKYKSEIVQAVAEIPTAQVAQVKALGGVLFASISTSFDLSTGATFTSKLRAALHKNGLTEALVSGPPAIKSDVTPILGSDLRRGEIVAVGLALVLLILFLGFSWAIFIPFLFGAAAISLAIGLVYLLAQRVLMVVYVPNIVELIGLGLAIDYSLLMLHRLRQESHRGEGDFNQVIVRTMETAGRTVAISGATVAIGLATLLLIPIPFVRSLGLAGILIPLVSMAAAFTLQPALFSLLGPSRISSHYFHGLIAGHQSLEGFFSRLARWVIARPKSTFIATIVVLLIGASGLLALQVTPSSLTAIPASLESSKALSIITGKAGAGSITPSQLIIDLGSAGLAKSASIQTQVQELSRSILKDPEVFVVATDKSPPFVDSTGRFLRLYIFGRHALGTSETNNLVTTLRTKFLSPANFPAGTKIYLAGAPAQGADLVSRILHSAPWVALLILFLTYVILVRGFRSIFLPIKAILLDLFSIAFAFGSTSLVFHLGWGESLFGLYHLDQIEIWVLIFLFAVLFGLSMDYEVFIVSRMREAKDAGNTNEDAITAGLSQTGGVVSAAAIILVGALSGFIWGHFAGLQELGIGLAIGILIDATLIRALLLPSAMVLLGRWNWWLPESIARLAKVKASPLEERETRP
jgi:RND superfamily putative drug exporter